MANPMAVPIKGDNQSGATPVVPLTIVLSVSSLEMLFLMLCCKMLNKLADMILHNQRYYIHYPDISVDIFCSCIKFINVCTKSSAFQPCFYFSILSILNRFFIQRFSLIQMLVYHTIYTCWAVNGCLFTTDFDLVAWPLCWDVQRAPETLKHWKQGLMIKICKQTLISSRSVVRIYEGSIGLSDFCVTQGTDSEVIN